MVMVRHLHYPFETDMVGLTNLLLMDSIDHHDKLAIMTPLAVLLSLSPPSIVLALIHGLGLALTLVLVDVYLDSLLVGGMAHHEVK